jgi:hypothetical protein
MAILGAAAFYAYKQLKRTQTVYVDTFDTPVPNIIDISTVV